MNSSAANPLMVVVVLKQKRDAIVIDEECLIGVVSHCILLCLVQKHDDPESSSNDQCYAHDNDDSTSPAGELEEHRHDHHTRHTRLRRNPHKRLDDRTETRAKVPPTTDDDVEKILTTFSVLHSHIRHCLVAMSIRPW